MWLPNSWESSREHFGYTDICIWLKNENFKSENHLGRLTGIDLHIANLAGNPMKYNVIFL